MPSFPRTPFFATGALPPLRSGQVFLDDAEHFRHNRSASVATLRELFAFGPECRSRSLRNQRSPSPESAIVGACCEEYVDHRCPACQSDNLDYADAAVKCLDCGFVTTEEASEVKIDRPGVFQNNAAGHHSAVFVRSLH